MPMFAQVQSCVVAVGLLALSGSAGASSGSTSNEYVYGVVDGVPTCVDVLPFLTTLEGDAGVRCKHLLTATMTGTPWSWETCGCMDLISKEMADDNFNCKIFPDDPLPVMDPWQYCNAETQTVIDLKEASMIWTTTNNADASTDVHDKVLLAKGTWHYNAVDWAEPMSAAGSEHTVNADSVAVPFDACAPLTNTIVGMAIAQRGSCKFEDKMLNAQNAGASAILIIDSISSTIPESYAFTYPRDGMSPSLSNYYKSPVTIPSYLMSKESGAELLKDVDDQGTSTTTTIVKITMEDLPAPSWTTVAPVSVSSAYRGFAATVSGGTVAIAAVVALLF